MSDTPSILIIGAGAAGIAAGSKLLENGFSNIQILEAESRIGGRIFSIEFDGYIVDVGGQWVHGEQGNIVYEMVKDLDLLKTSWNTYGDNTYYLSDGTKVDKEISDKIFAIGNQVLDDEKGAAGFPPETPFGEYFVKSYNQKIKKEFKDNEKLLQLAKYFENWFHKFFTCLDSAKSWHDISTNGAMFVFKPCQGDQMLNWGKAGYSTILDILMKKKPNSSEPAPLEEKIHLYKRVTKITWDQTNDVLTKPTVRCSDGSTFQADHILITTSVGVLKKFHKDLFFPGLSAQKVNAIEHISLGTVNKILLKFPRKWWPDDTKGFSLLWSEIDSLNLVHEVPVFGPVDENGRFWLEDVFGFYVIDSHPRVLLGWVVGKLAAETEYMNEEDVITCCMFILRKFLGHLYDIPDADGVLRHGTGNVIKKVEKLNTIPICESTFWFIYNEKELVCGLHFNWCKIIIPPKDDCKIIAEILLDMRLNNYRKLNIDFHEVNS